MSRSTWRRRCNRRREPIEPKLYVILGSHACRTGILMLAHKRIAHRRVVLPSGLHPVCLRMLGFEGNEAPFRLIDGRPPRSLASADRMGTVPVLRIGGEWSATNGVIARVLDQIRPEPPLFPHDPSHRRAVEDAWRWGDEIFQMVARRVVLAASLHGPDALRSRGNDGRLGPLLWRHATVRLFGSRMIARFGFAIDARAERELLAALPAMLDRIDGWIHAGVLDGEALYAADFMIAPSLALLSYRLDLSDELDRRPAMALTDRMLPLNPA
jgi:glutathione S-transferase